MHIRLENNEELVLAQESPVVCRGFAAAWTPAQYFMITVFFDIFEYIFYLSKKPNRRHDLGGHSKIIIETMLSIPKSQLV
jgi:hypothetical protein